MGHKSEKTPFQLEGRFLGLVVKDGYKIKGLRLATAVGELYIKLSKEARASCQRVLVPGEWLQISGYQQLDYGEGMVKFKAEHIRIASPSADLSGAEQPSLEIAQSPSLPAVPPLQPAAPAPSASSTILFCQKSDCCKRGGRAVTEAIQQALGDRQLDDQVKLKGTGCMKQCKAGPNVIINKTRYSRIRPEDVPQIINRHFPATADAPTSAIADGSPR